MATPSPHVLGIDPKLYRHFAIGTITIAVIVAVFANGDTQNAMAQNQHHAEMQKANESKFGKTKLVDNRDDRAKERAAAAGFGADNGPPADMSPSFDSGSSDVSPAMVPAKMPVMIEPNQDAMAKMNADEQKKYLKNLQDEARKRAAKGPHVPTQAQIAALTADSAARAGPASTE